MEKLSNIFLQAEDEEGGTDPSIKYWLNVKKVIDAFETADIDFFWSKSEDGGETCPYLESGTIALLSHDKVIEELESYCQRWASGTFVNN